MKNQIFVNVSHDASMAIWDAEKDSIHIFEFEKMGGIKHFEGRRLARPYHCNHDLLVSIIEEEMSRHNVKNDYMLNWFYPGPFPELLEHTFWHRFFQTFNCEISSKDGFKKSIHHIEHAACGFYQSPFDKAVIITHDCWSVQSSFAISVGDRFDAGNNSIKMVRNLYDGFGERRQTYQRQYSKDSKYHHKLFDGWRYSPGRLYSEVALHLKTIGARTRNYYDASGKLLGLASYGNRDSEVYKRTVDRLVNNNMEFDALEEIFPYWLANSQYHRNGSEGKAHLDSKYVRVNRYPKGFEINAEDHAWIAEMANKSPYSLEEEQDIAAAGQDSFVRCILKEFEPFEHLLEEYDNNIVVSGGCALNLFANKALNEKYGANVYVPPNPDDNGLASGSLLHWVHRNSNKKIYEQRSLTYAGQHLFDLDQLDSYKKRYPHRQVNLQEISDILSDAKTIGLVQGRYETGKRALGNRSILGDAGISNMKEIINDIKNREYYRPFAPVCRLEDAHRWFDGPEEDFWMYDTMNLATTVKEEARDLLPAITHVDGTARLQTVTREQNEFLYDLLSVKENVLLNTSFNVGGKPILNTLVDAFLILDTTELDHVLVLDRDNTPWLFSKKQA